LNQLSLAARNRATPTIGAGLVASVVSH
jgi:hypothetical protein